MFQATVPPGASIDLIVALPPLPWPGRYSLCLDMLDPQHAVLLQALLAKSKKTSYVFTFHRQGVFDFTCAQHLPGMNGQILVVPPR